MSNEFKLVPLVPTEEMLVVMHDRILVGVNSKKREANILNDKAWWAAVVAAAPASPQAAQPVANQVAEYLTTLAARQNVELATERDIYKAEVNRLEPEIDTLRAQLAERDALLDRMQMNDDMPVHWFAQAINDLSTTAKAEADHERS